jgi:hypothetical protein
MPIEMAGVAAATPKSSAAKARRATSSEISDDATRAATDEIAGEIH